MQTLSAFETHTWCSDREMEDYIGTESCVDFQQNKEGEEQVALAEVEGGRRRSSEYSDHRRSRRVKKEYPPAISSPWVLKRYYTGDGRLIIREENVGGQDYFKVCRANGRLTLQLVPPMMDHEDVVVAGDFIDDDVECYDDEEPDPDSDDDEEEDDYNINNNVEYGGTNCDESVEGVISTGDRTAVESAVPVPVVGAVTAAVGGGVGEFCKRIVISRPCLFGMPVVQAIRTVHI